MVQPSRNDSRCRSPPHARPPQIVCTVTHDDGASYLPTDDDVGCALVYGFRAADGGPGAGHWVYSEPTLARVGCGPPSPGRADGEAAGRPSGEGAEEPAEEEDVEGTDILLASARGQAVVFPFKMRVTHRSFFLKSVFSFFFPRNDWLVLACLRNPPPRRASARSCRNRSTWCQSREIKW